MLAGPDQAHARRDQRQGGRVHGRLYFDAAAAGDLFLAAGRGRAPPNNATMVFTQILAIDDVIATTPAKAARKQWFRDYTSRYGSYSGVAAFAADAVELIADAVAKVGGDREPDPRRAGDLADRRAVRADPAHPGQPLRPDAAGADPAGGAQRPLAARIS